MKNDKLIYILLPAVAIIWLIIGYRFYQAIEQKRDTPTQSTIPIASIEETTLAAYELQLDYPDPFLKKEKRAVRTPSIQQRTRSPQVTVTTFPAASTNIPWERLTYHGMIENNQTTDRVAIVSLEGIRKLVKEGNQIGTFTLEQILKDSVKVRVGREAQYITRQGKIDWSSSKPQK